MLLDAHTHLDMYEPDELETALAQLESQQVVSWSMSVDAEAHRRNLGITSRSPWVLTSFGIHPWWAPQCVATLPEVRPLLEASPHYGEIGLDYRFVEDTAAYPAQHQVFAHFLEAAHRHDRIVNLHTSGAEADVASLLKHHDVRRAVVHWYSGPPDSFQTLLDLGCYFTVGVEVLRSEKIREIAAAIPLDRLLTETDNPSGLTWITGERGMPVQVADVVAKLAVVRSLDKADLQGIVWENFRRLLEDQWPPVSAVGQD